MQHRITGLIGILFAFAIVYLKLGLGRDVSWAAWLGAVFFFAFGSYQLVTGRGFKSFSERANQAQDNQ